MPKNTYHEDWGIGEWSGNNPQADIDPVTQTELGTRFQIYRGSSDFNINKVLIGNVQRNNYFKQLAKFTTFKEVVDQIYYQVEFITPWEPGSHSNKSAGGMCSQVRGVATAGRPTKCWMWLVKLMTLRPTYKQIQILTQHPDSPFLRAIGFLFLRYCCDPKQLWQWFQAALRDPEEMQIRKFDKRKGTVGQFLCEILINVEYEATHFPRIPIPLHKRMLAEMEEQGLKGLGADTAEDDRDDRHGGRSYRDSRHSDRSRRDSRDTRDSGRRDSRSYGGAKADTDRSYGGGRAADAASAASAADRSTADRDRSRSRGRRSKRSRSRSRGRERRKDRDRGKDRDRDRDRDRGRDRSRRHRDRDRDRDRGSHDKRSSRDRSGDADRKKERSSPTYE